MNKRNFIFVLLLVISVIAVAFWYTTQQQAIPKSQGVEVNQATFIVPLFDGSGELQVKMQWTDYSLLLNCETTKEKKVVLEYEIWGTQSTPGYTKIGITSTGERWRIQTNPGKQDSVLLEIPDPAGKLDYGFSIPSNIFMNEEEETRMVKYLQDFMKRFFEKSQTLKNNCHRPELGEKLLLELSMVGEIAENRWPIPAKK